MTTDNITEGSPQSFQLEIAPQDFENIASEMRNKIESHQSTATLPEDPMADDLDLLDLSSLLVEKNPETGIITYSVITTLDDKLVSLHINDKPASDGVILLATEAAPSDDTEYPFVTTLKVSSATGKIPYKISGPKAQDWQAHSGKIVDTGIAATQGRHTSSGI